MPKISVAAKGSAPDASDYIAYKRKQAVYNAGLASAIGKGEAKAIGHEFIKQKGFQNGVVENRITGPTAIDTLRFKK